MRIQREGFQARGEGQIDGLVWQARRLRVVPVFGGIVRGLPWTVMVEEVCSGVPFGRAMMGG